MSGRVAQLDAKSVPRSQPVLEQIFALEFSVRRRFHQLLIDNRDIPLRKILRRHSQLSGGEQPTLARHRRRTQRPKRITQITGRIGLGELFLIDVGNASHLQRHEYFFAQKLKQGLAARFFCNDPGNHIVRVAVLPLCAWVKIKRLARPTIQNFLSRDWLEHRRHQVILRPIVLITGGVRKQLANRNLLGSS